MPDTAHDGDEEFAERLARLLRAPETLDDAFEADLVRAIRADRPIDRPPLARRPRPLSPAWWRMPVTVRMSPLVGLALATSLVLAAGVGTRRIAASFSSPAIPALAAAVHDTVHVVRFVFVGNAKSVSLVGDFNGWGATATPLLTSGSRDTWVANVPVPRGRHEYAFIVDGTRWVADPFALRNRDDFDTESSIIAVGS